MIQASPSFVKENGNDQLAAKNDRRSDSIRAGKTAKRENSRNMFKSCENKAGLPYNNRE
jgi:hypothetical protein